MNRTRIINLFALIVCLFVMASCSSLYTPNRLNIPQHKRQGDATVSASAGVGGVDFQGNVALSDKVGFMVNATGGYGAVMGTEKFRLQNRMIELGVGTYKVKSRFHVLSLYGGVGGGSMYSYCNILDVKEYASSYYRYFVQPSYMYDSRHGTFGASIRYALVNLHETDFRGYHSFVEPALTFKFGGDHVRFVGQAGYSIYLDAPQKELDYLPVFMSIGVEFRLGDLMRKATKL